MSEDKPRASSSKYAKEAAAAVVSKLPDDHGFVLLVMPIGRGDSRMSYASNIEREDALNALKAFLIQAGHDEDWMRDTV